MATDDSMAPASTDSDRPGESPEACSTTTRVAFRCVFVYVGLYIFLAQMLTTLFVIPGVEIPEISHLPPVRGVATWVADHVLGFEPPIVVDGSGSGDKAFDWSLLLCLLVVTGVGTTVWSWLDRRRTEYSRLHARFRLFVRFALGSTMIVYGAAKAVPLQMGYGPSLTRLIEPWGEFSPMGVLWSFIGASPAFQVLTGCAELLGGILVLVPRTATLGALVCLGNSLFIFSLNMAYDVPVKLLSFHMVLLSLVLLAPHARRLFGFFVRQETVAPPVEPHVVLGERGQRIEQWAQLAFGAYLLAVAFYGSSQAWKEYGGGAPKPPFFGIWEIDEMIVDGDVRPPHLGDKERWRRVVFDTFERATFQRLDGKFLYLRVKVEPDEASLIITRRGDEEWAAPFTVSQPQADQLRLVGTWDGKAVEMALRHVDAQEFQLVGRGFHWVQEYPYNR